MMIFILFYIAGSIKTYSNAIITIRIISSWPTNLNKEIEVKGERT